MWPNGPGQVGPADLAMEVAVAGEPLGLRSCDFTARLCTNHKSQITNHKLQITNYKLQITNYKLSPSAFLHKLPKTEHFIRVNHPLNRH